MYLPPSPRPTQVLAMEIYRACDFSTAQIESHFDLEDAVITQIAGRTNAFLCQLAEAYTGKHLFPGPSVRDYSDWIQGIMAQILITEMRHIIGTAPRYGKLYSSPAWVFLGGDLRHPTDCSFPNSRSDPKSRDYVEYWGRCDDTEVVVVYGPAKYNIIPCHVTDDHPGIHAVEAFRRLHQVWNLATARTT